MKSHIQQVYDRLWQSVCEAIDAQSDKERRKRDSDLSLDIWAVKLAIANARLQAEKEGRYAIHRK
jgi:hypothetical protein